MEKLVTPAFWRGRRVFVTGHTGFKGGWLSLWLQHLGAEVFGYALPPSKQQQRHGGPQSDLCGVWGHGQRLSAIRLNPSRE